MTLGTSYKWDHTVFVSLWLAYFPQHNVLKVHSCCSISCLFDCILFILISFLMFYHSCIFGLYLNWLWCISAYTVDCDLLILKHICVHAHVSDCCNVSFLQWPCGQIWIMRSFCSLKSSCEVSPLFSLFPRRVCVRLMSFLPQHLEEFTGEANWIWSFCGNVFSRTIYGGFFKN